MRKLLLAFILAVASSLAYSPLQKSADNSCNFNPSGANTPGTGNLTCPFPSNVTSGGTLIVAVHIRIGSSGGGVMTGLTSITDTRGTTYTLLKESHGTATGVWLYGGSPGSGGANTVTVVPNGTYNYGWLTLLEYNGSQVTTTTSGTGSANTDPATVNNPKCGSFTPGAGNVQIVAALFVNITNTNNLAPDSPMVREVYGASATFRQAETMDYFMAAATSINPGATLAAGSTANYSCAAVALTTGVVATTARKSPPSAWISGFVASAAPTADWSLVVIPDQHPTSLGVPWVANSAYVASKDSTWNIKSIVFTGDIQANGETIANFGTRDGWNDLVALGHPIIAAPGNHDCNVDGTCVDRLTTTFDTYVGYSKVSSASWGPVNAFSGSGNDVGSYTETSGSHGNYAIRFSVNGHKFLIIALEFFPGPTTTQTSDPRTWAANLAAFYPDHKVIWVTHAYQTELGTFCTSATVYCATAPPGGTGGYNDYTITGQAMYDSLFKLRANSFLTFSGHFPDLSPHASRSTTTGTNGNTIYGFFADFQALTTAANDRILRLTFHESTAKFDAEIWRTSTDALDATSCGGSPCAWYNMDWPQ